MRTVTQKMGIKERSRSIFINAPADALMDINLPENDNQTALKVSLITYTFLLSTKKSRKNYSRS